MSGKSTFLSPARLSWQIPLTGYAVAFLLGIGLSASNENIRTQVEVIGLAIFGTLTCLGFSYTFMAFRRLPHDSSTRGRRHAIGGLLCNALLASLALLAASATHRAETRFALTTIPDTGRPSRSPQATGRLPVWIDTDPACGVEQTADVDDCWALLAAARSPELTVRGISTVFGNQDGKTVLAHAQTIMSRFGEEHGAGDVKIFAGSMAKSDSNWRATPASHALASALEKESLTIIALGPFTNIATLMKTRPDLISRIERIVLVAGKRPGQLFHPGRQWWFHFGDFNVSQDPRAAEVVLYSGRPLTLVPFELATQLTMTASDIERLRTGDDAARWLSDVSRSWLAFWRDMLGRTGFHPFDVLAVAYTAIPEHFTCKAIPARIGFSYFLEPFGMGRDLEVGEDLRGPAVTYCFDLHDGFKERLLTRLMGDSHASPG